MLPRPRTAEPSVISIRKVRSLTLPMTTPGTPRITSTSWSACSVSRAAQVTSMLSRS
jgi:hypothetical protein